VFFLYHGIKVSPAFIITHIAGLQLFFSHPIFTLWYIGLIVIYYCFYALRMLVDRTGRFSVGIFAGTFFLLFILKFIYPVLDNRLLIFWPVFCFGALKLQFAGHVKNYLIVPAVSVVIIFSYIFVKFCNTPDSIPLSWPLFASILLVNIVMIGFAVFLSIVSQTAIPPYFKKVVYVLSFASYCIYLFHSPVFHFTSYILGGNPHSIFRWLTFAAASVLLIAGSFVLQMSYDRFVNKQFISKVTS
jgi:peptidoglycan/LPS O-acetylase OafA/YrhL